MKVTSKGKGDRIYSEGMVGARTEPRFKYGDVSLWKFADDGKRYSLFMSWQEAYDICDALSALLDDADAGVMGDDVPPARGTE